MIGKLMQCFLLNSQHKYSSLFRESSVIFMVNIADESDQGIRKHDEFEMLVHRDYKRLSKYCLRAALKF